MPSKKKLSISGMHAFNSFYVVLVNLILLVTKLYNLLPMVIRENADDFENNVNSFFSKFHCKTFCKALINCKNIFIYLFMHSITHVLIFFFISTKGHLLIVVFY